MRSFSEYVRESYLIRFEHYLEESAIKLMGEEKWLKEQKFILSFIENHMISLYGDNPAEWEILDETTLFEYLGEIG